MALFNKVRIQKKKKKKRARGKGIELVEQKSLGKNESYQSTIEREGIEEEEEKFFRLVISVFLPGERILRTMQLEVESG